MKSKRQEALLEIIRRERIDTQEELTNALREAGFSVTQATVSRDIKELRLIKTLGEDGRYHYAAVRSASSEEVSTKLQTLFRDAVRTVDHACNMVVVKCLSGTAGAVCAAVDSMELPSVVGTLAGDDTVMIVARTEPDALRLSRTLKDLTLD
ncbi:MAG: arginine repressor [Ruminococcaceae bacterium]|nr:arginine repressor [Oscillospiraceae bacterium]